MTMSEKGLIIFVKNPVAGKVKTRLGATVGHDVALVVYNNLLTHTRCTAEQLDCDKFLFYDTEISHEDAWSESLFNKDVQVQGDLGMRMEKAFASVLERCDKAVIIGSDCPEINPQIIQSAFDRLDLADVVIGPTLDGGYYLLGMRSLHTALFRDMSWSTESVYDDTIRRIKNANLLYTQGPTLSDLDYEEDLDKFPSFRSSS